MRALRGLLIALALLVPVAGVLCCLPDPADACCSEERACPVGDAADGAHTLATPAPTFALEPALADAPVMLPPAADRLASASWTADAHRVLHGPPRAPTDPAQGYPLRN